jgi:hypothetical protein
MLARTRGSSRIAKRLGERDDLRRVKLNVDENPHVGER